MDGRLPVFGRYPSHGKVSMRLPGLLNIDPAMACPAGFGGYSPAAAIHQRLPHCRCVVSGWVAEPANHLIYVGYFKIDRIQEAIVPLVAGHKI